jgi:hypothetical protein
MEPKPMLRLTSLSCVLVAVVLFDSAGNAQIECQSEKGAGYPWAWREIDGKRCWYRGKAGMDKKLLHWETMRAPAAGKRTPPAITKESAERERLLHSYWPPLPPTDVFGDRFEAVPGRKP